MLSRLKRPSGLNDALPAIFAITGVIVVAIACFVIYQVVEIRAQIKAGADRAIESVAVVAGGQIESSIAVADGVARGLLVQARRAGEVSPDLLRGSIRLGDVGSSVATLIIDAGWSVIGYEASPDLSVGVPEIVSAAKTAKGHYFGVSSPSGSFIGAVYEFPQAPSKRLLVLSRASVPLDVIGRAAIAKDLAVEVADVASQSVVFRQGAGASDPEVDYHVATLPAASGRLMVSAKIPSASIAQAVYSQSSGFVAAGAASLATLMVLVFIIVRQFRRVAQHADVVAKSEQRFDAVIRQIADGLYVQSMSGQIVVTNNALALTFAEAAPDSLQGGSIVGSVPWEKKQDVERQIAEATKADVGFVSRLEVAVIRGDGSRLPVEHMACVIKIGDERFVLGQIRDITARKNYEHTLVRQATVDETTKLPNRRLFNDRLNQAISRCQRFKARCAVMFVDLDHFKRINDTFGHGAGDLLLQRAAERLQGVCREMDTVARFGGDEFVVLLADFENEMDMDRFAERIISVFESPFQLDGREVVVTASVGVSVFPDNGEDSAILIQHADTALYEAKRNGRNQFQFFDNAMNTRVHETLVLDGKIRQALDNEEFEVFFQPICDPVSGKVVKGEALLRWTTPGIGEVPPDVFVPIAEDNGVIVPVGEWVMRQSCEYAKRWLDKGIPVSVSVNVSARQFVENDFIDSVFDVLQSTALPPGLLEIELTERILIGDDENALATVHSLKELGVSLSLDDFGTGYSSLSYLTKFPLNTLKIDKSFITNLEENIRSQELTKTIVAMAKTLGLKLVAEGVETPAQSDVLVSYGCDYVQGYLYGKPMSAADFEKRIFVQ